MAIEERDVSRLVREAFPEFGAEVDRHIADWPDDPMIYLLVGSLFQFVADMPEGPDRVSVASRMYALTEKMLQAGSEQVQDCFSIEMIEPLASTSANYPNFETSLGAFGKKDLAAKREWCRRYDAMNSLVNDLNKKFGAQLFEGVGIRDDTVRVIANPRLWRSLGAHRDSMFRDIERKWFELTGHHDGIEITEPADNGFQVLRQS